MDNRKKIIFISLFVVLTTPLLTFSHTNTQLDKSPHFGMMQAVEEQALGPKTHEEMEELMEKMMSGNLSSEETNNLIKLMREHPGEYGMMATRMASYGSHMMPGMHIINGTGALFWINQTLIWIFLLLSITALWKWIKKTK